MKFLIDCGTLYEKLHEDGLVLIDVRSNLQEPDKGHRLYMENHLPGAHYFHLDNDLSSEVKEHGGNHPLPDIDVFAEKLREIGVSNDSTLVVYDGGNEMYAPRAWWLLRYIGIEKAYVLNGGYRAWIDENYPVTDEIKDVPKGDFTQNIHADTVVAMEEVRDRNREKAVLLDSRAYNRYIGEVEPLYAKAGHIPGAKNYFWENVLDEAGNWKSQEALQAYFADLKQYETVIVSCGSGISACPNILALQMAGFDNVKLYAGSYSDWISYDENEVETEEA